MLLFSSYANFGLLAAVSCTKVHDVTGNKYKFAQFVHDDSYKSPQVWSVAKYDFNVL